MAPRPLTVIGFLGTNRDQSTRGPARWKRWRPTVALCQHPTLSVGRLMLLHAPAFDSLADTVAADIGHVSPRTEVVRVPVKLADPWNLEQVTRALLDFASQFAFDPGAEDYLVHITTGTHVA